MIGFSLTLLISLLLLLLRSRGATWKRKFKFPWRKAGPPNHLDDEVDADQWVVNKELSVNWDPAVLSDKKIRGSYDVSVEGVRAYPFLFFFTPY